MRNTIQKPLMLAAVAFAALAFAPSMAQAQTEAVTATVTVQNTLTTAVVDNMDFGTIAAISSGATTASAILNGVTDVVTTATGGAPAVVAMIDNTNVQGANLTVEDGAAGAAIQITIDNVTNPTFGGSSFTLASFTTSWNGAAAQPAIIGTAFARNFDAVFGGGTNTLDIGATLTTTATTTYSDGIYPGSFEVTFSY